MLSKFYIRIVVLITFSLLIFSALTFFLLREFEHEFYDDPLLKKAPILMAQLLPGVTAPVDEYRSTIPELEVDFDIKISVFSPSYEHIWGDVSLPGIDLHAIKEGAWEITDYETRWTTRLPDGRLVSVKLTEAPFREEISGMVVFLPLIAIILSIVILPFSRSLTGRLERLNNSVQKVGHNKLEKRVPVEGSDEIAALAQSFNLAIDRISDLLNAQKMLLANASHELRTPLARIRLGLELLRKNDTIADKYNLTDDIRELDALIDELLVLSRLSIDRSHITFDPVDLSALVNEEIKRYDGIDVRQWPELPIQGNSRLIGRLLRNLLDNAHIHGASPVSVDIVTRDASVELVVSDAGTGLKSDDLGRLFSPFSRGKDRQDVAGHGLGLAIVKEIADVHSAHILVEKARISICFPKTTEHS